MGGRLHGTRWWSRGHHHPKDTCMAPGPVSSPRGGSPSLRGVMRAGGLGHCRPRGLVTCVGGRDTPPPPHDVSVPAVAHRAPGACFPPRRLDGPGKGGALSPTPDPPRGARSHAHCWTVRHFPPLFILNAMPQKKLPEQPGEHWLSSLLVGVTAMCTCPTCTLPVRSLL